MKILFAGGIERPHQSGSQRLQALRDIGADVAALSLTSVQSESTARGITRRFLPVGIYEKFLSQKANTAGKMILESAKAENPDVIWLEWPRMVPAAAIKELKRNHPKAIIVSYQDDNPFGPRRFAAYGWHRFFDAMPFYDLHFVKRSTDVQEYKARGAGRVVVFMTGYPEHLFFPDPLPDVADSRAVVFVGTALDDRVGFLDRLTGELKVDVHIHGERWDRTPLYKDRQHLLHGPLTDTEYRQVVSSAKIALGFVSHSNLDEYTGRLFEIPACGTMFLGEGTATQKSIYAPDKEAAFFDSVEQCSEKIQYYLAHDEHRAQVAMAGQLKATHYGFRNRMKEALQIINESCAESHS